MNKVGIFLSGALAGAVAIGVTFYLMNNDTDGSTQDEIDPEEEKNDISDDYEHQLI